MTEQQTTVHRETVTPTTGYPVTSESSVVTRRSVSTATLLRRVTVLIFGIIQLLLVLRIVLEMLGAHRGNDIVALIIGLSDPLVMPFRGIFGANAVGGATAFIDIAALAALVGWTILELVIVAAVGLIRTDRAS